MLEQLYIKNVALIDEALIEFNRGLNILSGETGAGKSIIIGSITFVLGGRATKDFIQKDCEQAKVEILLNCNSDEISNSILEMGIDTEEDNSILISRTYTKTGRNICKINGKPATLSMIKEISQKLIDIHGQHEHQSLLNPKKHIELLDKFCDEKMDTLKQKLFQDIIKYKQVLKQISSLSLGENKDEKIDFLKFQINEISEAKLTPNEEEELNERRIILAEASKLKAYYETSLELLYSGEDMPALDKISIAMNNILSICEVDDSLSELSEELQEVYVKLEDIVYSLRKKSDEITEEPEELNLVEERIDLINRLKRKYGSSISEILKFYQNAKVKLDIFLNSEEKVAKLMTEKNELEKEIKQICKNLSQLRKNKAFELEKEIESNLCDLGMKDTKLKIVITNKETFSKDGFDKVEFLISTNLGEDLKPLSKIASGGEMSRIMLSLKAVLSVADNIDTFIFDEIDTGISGRTAQMVAEKMSKLATKNQILCITHLPQIATMGDTHYLIEKFSDNITNNTNTKIKQLTYEQTIDEIARMTAGAEITDATLISAKEMIEQAKKIKKTYSVF